jgi:hypothetical protein
MIANRNACRNLDGKPKEITPVARHRRSLEDNIKVDL